MPRDMRPWEKDMFDRVFSAPALVANIAIVKRDNPKLAGSRLLEAAVARGGLDAATLRDCVLIRRLCTAQQRFATRPSIAEYELAVQERMKDIKEAAPAPHLVPESTEKHREKEKEEEGEKLEKTKKPWERWEDIDPDDAHMEDVDAETAVGSLDGFSLTSDAVTMDADDSDSSIDSDGDDN